MQHIHDFVSNVSKFIQYARNVALLFQNINFPFYNLILLCHNFLVSYHFSYKLEKFFQNLTILSLVFLKK